MSKKIKIIVIVLVFIIIVSLIGVFLLLEQLRISNIKMDLPTQDEILTGTVDISIEKLQSRDKFYTVKTCISQYYYYVTQYFEQPQQEQYYLDNIYSLLDSRYKTEFNVTQNNIKNKLNLKQYEEFQIKEVYTQKESLDITTYLVYGWLNNTSTKDSRDYGFILQVDPVEKVFCIAPYEYMEKHKLINPLEITQTSLSVEQIPKNNVNKYKKNTIIDENVAQDYLENYLKNIVYHPEEAYDMLDKNYREKRFGSYDNFKQYIKDNNNTLKIAKLNKYMVDRTGNTKEYICVDQFENYYIFNEKYIWDYSMQLDAYTITRDIFTQEYNSSDEVKKVALNIDKFFTMINSKDYKNAYSLLSQNYRQNYFKTEQDFKKYVQSNFFEYNKIEYNNIEESSGTYLQKIRVTDKTGKSNNIIEKTIVMKLEDKMNFILSFNY